MRLISNSVPNLIIVFLTTIFPALGLAAPNLAAFITDYIANSESQLPFYTIVLCGGKERELLPTLSVAFKSFYIILSSTEYNVTAWNVSPDRQGFILDMECKQAKNILSQASDLTLFRKPYSWLLLTSQDEVINDTNVISIEDAVSDDFFGLRDLNLRFDSLVVLARAIAPDKFTLTEVYKVLENTGDLIVLDMGRWQEGNGIQFFSKDVAAWRRKDLRGITIPATIVLSSNDSWNHLDDMVNRHVDNPPRRCHAVIPVMLKFFNASLRYVISDSWGSLQNGSWSGMVNELVSKRAELGHTMMFITKERLEVIDYLIGDSTIRFAFIATTPPLSYSSNLFTLPFSRSVWLSCVLLIIVISLLLYVTVKHENRNNDSFEKGRLTANWSDIAMVNLGSICQQGSDIAPRDASGRIVTILLFFSVMFLYVSYSASIVALLQSSDTSIKTVKDLLESPLKCGAEDIVYQKAWFKAANDPIGRQLYLKKIIPKGEENANFISIDEGIEKVRQGLYAFHVEASPGYNVVQKTFTETEKCGLQELPTYLKMPEPWIPLRKNSPFSELFKIGIKVMREIGIEARAIHRLSTKKPSCSAPGSKFVSVGLVDCYHVFLILTYGLGSSVALLFIEKFVSKWLYQRNLKKDITWAKKISTAPKETLSNRTMHSAS